MVFLSKEEETKLLPSCFSPGWWMGAIESFMCHYILAGRQRVELVSVALGFLTKSKDQIMTSFYSAFPEQVPAIPNVKPPCR